MSNFTNEVATRCRAELARWNDGAGREIEDPFCAYVGEYWAVGVKNGNINGRTEYQNSKGKTYRPAWSSAFISYIYRKAGAGAEFYYHEGHIHYVVKALRAAAAASSDAKFLGRNPQTYAPKVGDIISAGRGDNRDVTYKDVLAKYGSRVVPQGHFVASHSDIVVEVDRAKGVLFTVGGNVDVDTVGEKKWKLNADGTLAKGASLICVIECLL